ncbi:MAG: Spy/CpxP family protein refolding chaperone [Giesbergeria sp.]|uniref:Spy/CpxP family protein refolding chaperone n=1 Tax=Giesbergeria sp. TaxID=2818473 RepID=UPI00260843F9|nr:Spy/CpxP family protein refolding chaperone [Giesbergeria sp.]MDD2610040.1 Spy/CpxP family protein refolding chaperone [Giesbergeria sp.]
MAFCLSRKLLATAVLAALSLPGWAQSDAAAPAAPAAAVTAPAAVSAPATTEAAKPVARSGPRAQRGAPGYQKKHHHYRQQRAMRGDTAATWQERRAQHQVQLKEQLQLSPTQATAWTEFMAAMEPTRHARLGWEGMEQLSTPERVDRMRALRIQHMADADRRGDAVKAFYAQLNPAQQKTFDAHHLAYQSNHQRMAGPRGRGMMPAAADGTDQRGWKHPDCMMDGSGPRRDGSGPRGSAPAAP